MPLMICSYFATCHFLFNFSLLPLVIATGGLQVETEAIMRLWERGRLLVCSTLLAATGRYWSQRVAVVAFYILVAATGRYRWLTS